MDLPLQVSDLPIETFNLLKQKATQRADRLRQVRDLILERRRQAIDMDWPLGRNDPELRQMATQRVDRLGALAHQKIACPEQHAPCCSFVFTATKLMVGRDAASQIASASAASFFCRLT